MKIMKLIGKICKIGLYVLVVLSTLLIGVCAFYGFDQAAGNAAIITLYGFMLIVLLEVWDLKGYASEVLDNYKRLIAQLAEKINEIKALGYTVEFSNNEKDN